MSQMEESKKEKNGSKVLKKWKKIHFSKRNLISVKAEKFLNGSFGETSV